jgi:predicted nucleic acid-binding protein
MTNAFVIDNSVVMSWCFQDESNTYADAVLGKLTEWRAVVPSIWPLEVVNVLLVAERRQRLEQAESARFLTLLAQLPIVVADARVERKMQELLALGRAHQLSSYDAAYLDLAMRQGIPIATLDKNLLVAAKQINVPILSA